MRALSLLLSIGLAVATQHVSPQAPLIPASAPRTPILSAESSKELLDLHKKLVEIESISGNEGTVGKWLKAYLEQKSWTVELQEVSEGRANILAYPGKERKTKILVTSHIDTVPPYIPYSTQKTNGSTTLWGRGSVDAKACVAAQTIAALNLVAPQPHSSSKQLPADALALLFVVGEETGGDGMHHFSSHKPHNYTAVLFGEPTEGKLAAGHKGLVSFELHVKGRAAHSGYPWLGVSANDVLVEALGALLAVARKKEDEGGLPSSEKYGASTLNIGQVEGGVAANVVAETASAKVSIRIADGTPQAVMDVVHKALEPVVKSAEERGAKIEVEITQKGYPPVDMEADVDGFESITVNYGTDVPNLQGDHVKFLYGPGTIFVAHSDHEHLKVEELERAVKDYEKLILHAVKL